VLRQFKVKDLFGQALIFELCKDYEVPVISLIYTGLDSQYLITKLNAGKLLRTLFKLYRLAWGKEFVEKLLREARK